MKAVPRLMVLSILSGVIKTSACGLSTIADVLVTAPQQCCRISCLADFAYEASSLLIDICIRLHILETKGLVWLPLILPDQSIDPSPRPTCCTIDVCSPGDGQMDYCCRITEWDRPFELDPLGLAIPQLDKHDRYVVLIDDGASVSSCLAV